MSKFKRKKFSLACLFLGLGLSLSLPVSAEPFRLLVSIRPLELMLEGFKSEDLIIETLVPAKLDPHQFALRPSDMRKLNRANAVVWIGPNFERFLEEPLKRKTNLKLYSFASPDVIQQGPVQIARSHDHSHSDDAHVWLNPLNVKAMQAAIFHLLRENSVGDDGELLLQLKAMHKQIDKRYNTMAGQLKPYRDKPFGVAHDGYSHFVSAFKLNQVAAITALPEQRLSAKRLHELKQRLSGANCLIVQPNDPHSTKLATTFSLSAVSADILASSEEIDTIDAFFADLTRSFLNCLAP